MIAAIPDVVVTLGGDGTVLHAAGLFDQKKALPPMFAFAMGTLGFLTPFEASNFRKLLTRCVAALLEVCSCRAFLRFCSIAC
jgi:NAD kinase